MTRTFALRARLDLIILVALTIGSGIWATQFWNTWTARGGQSAFYQLYFEPAVMIACGRGFVISKVQPKPLEDFLFQRTDRFDCADLPPDLALDPEHIYQGAWFYLETTVGWAWRVLGISWSGMGPLFGLLFAISVGLAFGILRLSMNAPFAALGAIGLALSSSQLLNLPHLRDYAKAPFALALVLIIGVLVSKPPTTRRVLSLAAAYGAVLGVGYGFRTDFLAFVPVFLIVVAAFLECAFISRIPLKAAAIALCLAVFVIVSWPVTHAVYEKGGCQWHVALLGLQSPFDPSLRVEPAVYDFGHAYADSYVEGVVNGYRWRLQPGDPKLVFCSPEYDAYSGAYLRGIFTTFPADFVTRAYASALQVVELPYQHFTAPMADWAAPLYAVRAGVLQPNHRWGLAFVIVAIWLAGMASLRLATFLVLFLAYFGGYPAVQFQERHYFYLEFIGWWAIAFVAQRALVSPAMIRAMWAERSTRLVAASRSAALLIVVGLVAASALAAVRWYQAKQVRQLLATYTAAPTVPVPATASALEGIAPNEWPQLLEVIVPHTECGESPSITFRYDQSDSNQDFTRTITLPHASVGGTRIFVPVFQGYAGLVTPIGCAVEVRRVTDLRTHPILVGAVLPQSWESLPLYQRLVDWEVAR